MFKLEFSNNGVTVWNLEFDKHVKRGIGFGRNDGGGGGGGVLPYISYIGMFQPRGYHFQGHTIFHVFNRVIPEDILELFLPSSPPRSHTVTFAGINQFLCHDSYLCPLVVGKICSISSIRLQFSFSILIFLFTVIL